MSTEGTIATATTETDSATPSTVTQTVSIPAKSNRTFSKRLVLINSVLAWAVMFYAIYGQQASAVTVSAFAFLATICGTYMGVGASDLKQMLSAMVPNPFAQPPYDGGEPPV
jgi:hypothetical protein